ncbi:carbohydrate ABC transporter permease [Longirhabdus pacifica]|uniref:carbohydrate ABC transporter permease n=1 Tax=Longirhabdus pacifica TaxID=2305227 RepID=UPI00100870E6|nr:carbohydrate ABC transporter permease [Longirhabdus pacifica]
MKKRTNWRKVTLYSSIIIYLFIIIFPFIWTLITSFKTSGEIMGENALRIIPEVFTWDNYTVLFEKGILGALKTSFIVSMSTTLYIVVVATLASYAISRFHFKGKSLLMGLILAVSMFPQMITVGPIYQLFLNLGWTNSYAVVLPYSTITLPLAVWILVTHFNQIPHGIEEAARIDGASPLQTLVRVIFPLAAPGVFTTGIIVFISAWNEFLLTITLNINREYHTVPVFMSFLKEQFSILWGEVTAATIVVTIPTLIIVLLFQKQIVSGLVSGSIKE